MGIVVESTVVGSVNGVSMVVAKVGVNKRSTATR